MSEPFDLSFDGDPGVPLPLPGKATLAKHLAFLLITFCTATIAGTLPPFGPGIRFPPSDLPLWESFQVFIAWVPTLYSLYVINVVYDIFSDPNLLNNGLRFSIPLLIILFSHEMGHYIACRIYKVDCTLPFFIPTPPLVGPAGTFGAFIKIKSRIPTRRAIFDIGVAGPIAGFIALLPVAFIGIAIMEMRVPGSPVPEGSIVFADPILMKAIGRFFGKDLSLGEVNPYYFAAWMGMLVTALNLIPSGQLDGGHAIYAALGERLHALTGKIAFAVMATLSIVGMLIYKSPSGFLIAILLGVMMRIPHPQPYDNTPLDAKRRVVAVLTLLIFILCFVPFPLQIT